MQRLILTALISTLLVHAQQKKIVVLNANAALMEQLQSATPDARIVAVERAKMMDEIGDADGYIGEITSAEVRAAKNLKWVGVMSAGVETSAVSSRWNERFTQQQNRSHK